MAEPVANAGGEGPVEERPLLDEFDDFLCGRADPETRERIGRMLADPQSDLRRLIEAARSRAERLTGWSERDA